MIADPPRSPMPSGAALRLYSRVVARVIEGEARELERLREIEAVPLPSGRPQGCEWAIEERAQTVALLGEVRALLDGLALGRAA